MHRPVSLSPEDRRDLELRGITVDKFMQDLAVFRQGLRPVVIDRPCRMGDGIQTLDEHHLMACASRSEEEARRSRFSCFIPASGAATRMFQCVIALLARGGPLTRECLEEKTPEATATLEIVNNIERLAFYEDLRAELVRHGWSLASCRAANDYRPLLERLIAPDGLGYGSKPKALLKFHTYSDRARTALEEHIAEVTAYATDRNGRCSMHFTISPEHRHDVEALLDRLRSDYASRGIHLDVTTSIQKPSTDTPAVDPANMPLRDVHGRLIFRPAGHGALIGNLNDLDGDIVFIKNIDNVVPDRLKAPTIHYKKALGGYLVELQDRIAECLKLLDLPSAGGQFENIVRFCETVLGFASPARNDQEGIESVKAFLNRPLRVCGLVKNQGEPGGGPFWVKDAAGRLSLQIVEKAQIDLSDPYQKELFESSTHFNPVDLVCGLRDPHGRPFDLQKFVDSSTAFISVKSKDGRMIKALELPGLWNGAMAHWITVFVEVPLATFNPVKTVNDLFRPEHS